MIIYTKITECNIYRLCGFMIKYDDHQIMCTNTTKCDIQDAWLNKLWITDLKGQLMDYGFAELAFPDGWQLTGKISVYPDGWQPTGKVLFFFMTVGN